MAVVTQEGDFIAPGIYRIKWETVTNGDTGSPDDGARLSDKSVQILGTFGTGGTAVLQGSNDGGTTWHTLSDPQGNDISFTAAGTAQVLESTQLIRPSVSGGDTNTDLDVWVVGKVVR